MVCVIEPVGELADQPRPHSRHRDRPVRISAPSVSMIDAVSMWCMQRACTSSHWTTPALTRSSPALTRSSP
jgi:hypothetical protein